MMRNDNKKVVLICFHDRICLSIRALSAELKRKGHIVYLLFIKDERSAVIRELNKNASNYQIRINGELVGFGEDVNPISKREKQLIQEIVNKIKPDVVGISARTGSIDLARKIVRLIRNEVPNARYIGGGYGPSLQPEVFLRFLDCVCIGEAESIIDNLVCTNDIKSVNNICYVQKGRLQYNKMSEPININDLPIPDWSRDNKYLIEDNRSKGFNSLSNGGVYDILTSRGCPSSCTYCMACQWGNVYKRFGAKFPRIRQRSARNVIQELEYAVNQLGAEYIRFRDSIFGFDKTWLKEFINMYDKEIGLPFHCLLDERYVDDDTIKWLAQSGLERTTVGIQSVDEKIRKTIFNRQTTNKELLLFAETLTKYGIKIRYDIIGWNPFEDEKILSEGMTLLSAFPKAMDVFVIQLNMFPGSPIRQLYKKIKPQGLSIEKYDYWAMIYTLILYSTKTAKEAWQIETKPGCGRGKVEIANALQAMSNNIELLKLTCRINIKKGDVLHNSMVCASQSSETGIPWKEKYRVIGCTLKHDLLSGDQICWDDIVKKSIS